MKKKSGKTKSKISTLTVGLSLFALSGGLPQNATAQNIACPQSMRYGDIAPCTTTNTVVVHPDNTRTVNGCLSASGAFSRGRCAVTQKFPLRPVQVSIVGGAATMSNGTANMNINNFNIVTNANGPTYTGTKVNLNVPIGAALNVNANQAGGDYVGVFVVNANRL